MQEFYAKFAQDMKGTSEPNAELMIHQIGTDPSLAQLLPYFVQFLTDEVSLLLSYPRFLNN